MTMKILPFILIVFPQICQDQPGMIIGKRQLGGSSDGVTVACCATDLCNEGNANNDITFDCIFMGVLHHPN